MFNEKDLNQIKRKGISLETIDEQIKNFKNGFPYSNIVNPAVIGEGILKVSDDEALKFISSFNLSIGNIKTVKFVPASGAASRMFKELFSFIEDNKGKSLTKEDLTNNPSNKAASVFINGIDDFAFYDDLDNIHQSIHSKSLQNALDANEYVEIIDSLLSEKGLNYGSLPKGLLRFHRYDEDNRTPFQEHLVEGAEYIQDNNQKVNLHFTVSPEHREKFQSHRESVQSSFESKFKVNYQISFSEQKSATDTIAVDLSNNPFRNADESLLFRPAGHGALIENLNDIDGDIIFVKNIDNVVPDRIKEQTFKYKKVLAGILLDYQNQIFSYLRQLDNDNIDKNLLDEIKLFMENTLFVIPPKDFTNKDKNEKVSYYKSKLNRPIRMCGMVKNEGEPGGGPFWVKNDDGSLSLQVVESAQIDLNDPQKKDIVNKATHFNPVDLVCGVKDYKGNKFNLLKFRDPKTGFISQKSKDGKDLKAQELPGLWNGAMAEWNTVFVEVPIITFNPVKTINDLLRDEHLK